MFLAAPLTGHPKGPRVSDIDPPFEPTSDPETAAPSQQFEPLNVCRTVALGAVFGSEPPLGGLEEELLAMGLPGYLAGTTGWSWHDAVRQIERGTLAEGRSRVETLSRASWFSVPI